MHLAFQKEFITSELVHFLSQNVQCDPAGGEGFSDCDNESSAKKYERESDIRGPKNTLFFKLQTELGRATQLQKVFGELDN